MAKPINSQLVYKKKIGFTKQQKEAFDTLSNYGVNVNQFIRQAIKEKIKRDWKEIRMRKQKEYCPF